MGTKSKISFYILLCFVVFLVIYDQLGNRIRNITNRLPVHPSKRFNKRDLSDIDEIIIHHTATPSRTTKIKTIASYHVEPGNHICEEGCPGISYHFMINYKGEIYQVNDLETISYQCGGCNSTTVGVCLIGNFNTEIPSEKVLKSVARTIKHINKKVGRSLSISAHKDHKNTSCPGDNTNMGDILNLVYPLA